MVRYQGNQNKVVLLMESGTYAAVSGNGYWPGQVITNAIEDNENKMQSRFLGASTRSFSTLEQGPRDVVGTLSFHPQDMRMMGWAIGSVVDTSGTASFHKATQVNSDVWQSAYTSGTNALTAPISFTIEDSKTVPGTGRNFIRTINGCVIDSISLTANKGEKVMVEVSYIGQTLSTTSGATTSFAAQPSGTPYLWNHCSLTLLGSTIPTATQVQLTIKQNMEGPHYLNGSRDISVPFPKNRENSLDVTLDLNSNEAIMLYNAYKNNTMFNGTFDMNADLTTGSQHAIFGLSGCYIDYMDAPSEVEGPVDSTVKIIAPIIVGSFFDSSVNASKYNPW